MDFATGDNFMTWGTNGWENKWFKNLGLMKGLGVNNTSWQNTRNSGLDWHSDIARNMPSMPHPHFAMPSNFNVRTSVLAQPSKVNNSTSMEKVGFFGKVVRDVETVVEVASETNAVLKSVGFFKGNAKSDLIPTMKKIDHYAHKFEQAIERGGVSADWSVPVAPYVNVRVGVDMTVKGLTAHFGIGPAIGAAFDFSASANLSYGHEPIGFTETVYAEGGLIRSVGAGISGYHSSSGFGMEINTGYIKGFVVGGEVGYTTPRLNW